MNAPSRSLTHPRGRRLPPPAEAAKEAPKEEAEPAAAGGISAKLVQRSFATSLAPA